MNAPVMIRVLPRRRLRVPIITRLLQVLLICALGSLAWILIGGAAYILAHY